MFRLDGKAAGMAIALLALLIYVPWAILTWPGADVFAIHLAIFLTVAYALGMIGGRVGRGWHWAPALIVGFFVVVIVTNVVFLGVAEQGITGLFATLLPTPQGSEVVDSRFPGTVSHDYQEKEALYNAYLRQVEKQQARGWQVRKGWLYKPVVDQAATFVVEVHDRDGQPVSGAQIEGPFPAHLQQPRRLRFRDGRGGAGRVPGHADDAACTACGNWCCRSGAATTCTRSGPVPRWRAVRGGT